MSRGKVYALPFLSIKVKIKHEKEVADVIKLRQQSRLTTVRFRKSDVSDSIQINLSVRSQKGGCFVD